MINFKTILSSIVGLSLVFQCFKEHGFLIGILSILIVLQFILFFKLLEGQNGFNNSILGAVRELIDELKKKGIIK